MKVGPDHEHLERLLLGQEQFLAAVNGILEGEHSRDEMLRALVQSANEDHINRIPGLEEDRIYHTGAIRRMCVKYRLRFLPARHFKGVLPLPVIHELRRLQRWTDGPLGGFMVMAPTSRFRLCDGEGDPLLFARVGAERYYLVYKWGNDLTRLRACLNWPFRTWRHLAAGVLLLSLLMAMSVPNGLITNDPQMGWWGAHRVLFVFWSVMVCASFTVFGWFTFLGQFSSEEWRSRHFN